MNLKNLIGQNVVRRAALLVLLAIVAATPTQIRAETPKHSEDIVDTAIGAGQFKTLTAALEAAGLVDALKGSGPFTVFAPTDEAFAKLPAGTVDSLLKPENKEKLKAILLYHVVPGKVPASKVLNLNGRSVKTLQGGAIKVRTKHGVKVNDAKVITTDVNASNGVIHAIDTVLIPPM
ncbi:MAG: fasciclin domain-containing protein [Pyrinomonadaceae bacterium]